MTSALSFSFVSSTAFLVWKFRGEELSLDPIEQILELAEEVQSATSQAVNIALIDEDSIPLFPMEAEKIPLEYT